MLVELGLDASGSVKGQKAATGAFKQTTEAAQKSGKDIEDSVKKAQQGLKGLAQAAIALFAVFTVGRGIKEFVQDIVQTDAALDRLARNIGEAPRTLSAWEQAIERAGGSADGAASSFASFSDAIQQIKISGESGLIEPLAKLAGATHSSIVNLAQPVDQIFKQLNVQLNALSKTDPQLATAFAKRLGLDQGTANFLTQDPVKNAAIIDQITRTTAVTKAMADADQKLQESTWDVIHASTNLGRSILLDLSPYLLDVLQRMKDWVAANHEWLESQITEKVKEFGDWLKSIPWDEVAAGLKTFVSGVSAVVRALGGAQNAAEIFLAFWVETKLIAALSGIARITAAVLVLGRAMTTVGNNTAIGRLINLLAMLGTNPVTTGPVDDSLFTPPADTRNLWQRWVPEIQGGRPAPSRSSTSSPRSPSAGGAHGPANAGTHGWVDAGAASTRLRRSHKAGGLTDLGARALISRWKNVEANGGPASLNSTGHFGIAQWSNSRQQSSGLGRNTDFDAQLQAAIRELNGSEGSAKAVLNNATTAAEAARGASLYKRAEGFAQSGGYTDNFQGKTVAGIPGISTSVTAADSKYSATRVVGGIRKGLTPQGWVVIGPAAGHGLLDAAQSARRAARARALSVGASGAAKGSTNNNSSTTHTSSAETNINGPISIHTQATDAGGIAKSPVDNYGWVIRRINKPAIATSIMA